MQPKAGTQRFTPKPFQCSAPSLHRSCAHPLVFPLFSPNTPVTRLLVPIARLPHQSVACANIEGEGFHCVPSHRLFDHVFPLFITIGGPRAIHIFEKHSAPKAPWSTYVRFCLPSTFCVQLVACMCFNSTEPLVSCIACVRSDHVCALVQLYVLSIMFIGIAFLGRGIFDPPFLGHSQLNCVPL